MSSHPTPAIYGNSNRTFDYSLTSISTKSINSTFEILPGRGQEYDHLADGVMGSLLSPSQSRDASLVRFAFPSALEYIQEHLYVLIFCKPCEFITANLTRIYNLLIW